MKKTTITVLMPVYNGEKYLKEAIDSILCQTYKDFEFLIINDGSTDKSEEIIRTYQDPRIRLINQPNGGVSKALNTGLKNASGKYIARMDADDVSYPKRLQIQHDFLLKYPEYILIGSDVNYINQEGEFIFRYNNPAYTDDDIKKTVKKNCPFVHSTVFFEKSYAVNLGGYPEKAHGFEDHLLWTKFSDAGKLCNLNLALASYRFNASSVTIDEKDMDKVFNEIKRKALNSGEITEEEEKQLLTINVKMSIKKKESSYNRMLGKKYLWNNYRPKKARQHLIKAIKAEPFNSTSYSLFILSFLPESAIGKIYKSFSEKNS